MKIIGLFKLDDTRRGFSLQIQELMSQRDQMQNQLYREMDQMRKGVIKSY